jgi:hypothetical protein
MMWYQAGARERAGKMSRLKIIARSSAGLLLIAGAVVAMRQSPSGGLLFLAAFFGWCLLADVLFTVIAGDAAPRLKAPNVLFVLTLSIAGGLLTIWIATPRRDVRRADSDQANVRVVMQNVTLAIDHYRRDNGQACPPDLQTLVSRNYMIKVPVDPWGNPFSLICPADHYPFIADLISAGPDGKRDTADDIRSWKASAPR